MHRFLRIVLTLLLAPVILAVVGGFLVAPAFLHPVRRPLTADLVQQANASFAEVGTKPEAFASASACRLESRTDCVSAIKSLSCI
jgi:hypothetical protein